MYIPASFKIEELQELHDVVRAAPLANLVISNDAGLVATPLPLLMDESATHLLAVSRSTAPGSKLRRRPSRSLITKSRPPSSARRPRSCTIFLAARSPRIASGRTASMRLTALGTSMAAP
ncbi:FMN-binding negative transcriptional regulator [Methylocystis sp. H4A]|nr:FMN-binding negative transcriptional regulator [Methylocystis sp. H4A]